MKASQRRTLQREFNKMVRERVNNRCEAMGQGRWQNGRLIDCSPTLNCSHINTQGAAPNLKMHPWNATSMCTTHHRRWWPNVGESGPWIRRYIGSLYDELLYMKYSGWSIKKLTPDEVRAWWTTVKGWW